MVLLGVVALLTNGTLPEGHSKMPAHKKSSTDLNQLNLLIMQKFEIQITPFSSGVNTILVQVSDFNNNPIYDANAIKVKMANPSKNIAPIEIPMEIT